MKYVVKKKSNFFRFILILCLLFNQIFIISNLNSKVENKKFQNNINNKNKNPEEKLKLKLQNDNEDFDTLQKGEIPYLSFLTLKVSYFQEMIEKVKNYKTFKVFDSKDSAFRVNIISFPVKDDENKMDLVVFFRGTEAWRIKNVMADFNLNEINLEENCQGCLVQQGYLDAYKAVEDAMFNFIKEEIQKLKEEGKELNLLYFSGHSLGGAMAEIATHFLLTKKDFYSSKFPFLKKIDKISLITFGAPKIGNKNFVERMEDEKRLNDNIRVVYGIDDVPFFPPEKLNYSQSHNGDLVYFRQNDFKNFNIVVGYNRGNKKKKGISPKQYLKDMNLEQRGIMNIQDRILDHLRYAGITQETLSNAVVKIRNME